MGTADTIPGISGGTVAVLTGIYERLVTAISHADGQTVAMVLKGQFRDAFKRVDGGFLCELLLGVVAGIACSTTLVLYLLENHLPVTFAAFAGLILGSVWILFHALKGKGVGAYVSLVLGACAAWGIVSLNTLAGSPNPGYVFVCGVVAICAMILPGISGSYILLLLGEYAFIIEKVKNVIHLQTNVSELTTLAIFAAGCVIGLIAFSKFLKWMLTYFHQTTVSVLCGFMLGSLKCLWPMQVMVTRAGKKAFEPLPVEMITNTLWCHVGIAAAAGLVLILVLHRLARSRASRS